MILFYILAVLFCHTNAQILILNQTITSSPTVGLGGAIVTRSYGQSVYVSAYNQNTLSVFLYDPASESLQLSQLLSPGEFSLSIPFTMTITPNGRFLYLISHSASNSGVLSFQRNDDGSLQFISQVKNDPQNTLLEAIYITSDNSYVYVTAEAVPYWSIFQIESNGSLTLVSTIQVEDKFTEGIDKFGDYVYVTASGIYVYNVNNVQNVVLTQKVAMNVSSITNPYSIKVSSSGKYLYVPARQSNTFSIFERYTNGQLSDTPIIQFKDGADGVVGLTEPIEAIEVGSYIFVSCYRGGIVGFQNVGDQFKYVGTSIQNGFYSAAVTNEGRNIYATSYQNNALYGFKLNVS